MSHTCRQIANQNTSQKQTNPHERSAPQVPGSLEMHSKIRSLLNFMWLQLASVEFYLTSTARERNDVFCAGGRKVLDCMHTTLIESRTRIDQGTTKQVRSIRQKSDFKKALEKTSIQIKVEFRLVNTPSYQRTSTCSGWYICCYPGTTLVVPTIVLVPNTF